MSDLAELRLRFLESYKNVQAVDYVKELEAEVERLTADPRMALTEADLRKVLELAWGSRLNPPKGAWERVEKVRAALREEGTK